MRTDLLLNFAAFAIRSASKQKPFCLRCWFQKVDASDKEASPEPLFADFQTDSPIWKGKCLHLLVHISRLYLGHYAYSQPCSLHCLVPQSKEQLQARSSLAVVWVKNTSCSSRSHWLCPERSVNPLFFSHKSAERRNEDGPSRSSYALQNTDLHQCF